MSRTCVKVNYHNWRHAFNVCQLMFAILTSTTWWNHFGEVEVLIVLLINITVLLIIIVKRDSDFSNSQVLAMVIACLCHDLDHRGTNNKFQVR